MSHPPNGTYQAILDTIKEKSKDGQNQFDSDNTMKTVIDKIGGKPSRDFALARRILTYWNELLRTGTIGMGQEDGTWNPNVCFVTDVGKKVLEYASRDPVNQNGYLAYLDQEVSLDTITRGYVEEALATYRACCYKATAMLIGAAVENLILDLRDELVSRLKKTARIIPKGMDVWQVKTVVESIATKAKDDLWNEWKRTNDENIRKLHEDADAKLLSIAAEFRKIRNSAGHPASLNPVDSADVHCNLLLFPATAKLIARLKKWVIGFYV